MKQCLRRGRSETGTGKKTPLTTYYICILLLNFSLSSLKAELPMIFMLFNNITKTSCLFMFWYNTNGEYSVPKHVWLHVGRTIKLLNRQCFHSDSIQNFCSFFSNFYKSPENSRTQSHRHTQSSWSLVEGQR